MNNIHGARLNMDILKPSGSGYSASHGADFVQFNDRWSQIINLRYDQDGSVYLIDWYDKNQCHRSDPDTHDRSNGRVFKIIYKNEKRTPVDLSKLTLKGLAELQSHPNEWQARHARRALQERLTKEPRGEEQAQANVILKEQLVNAKTTALRLRALWALHSNEGLNQPDLLALLKDHDEHLRAWAIQLLCEKKKPSASALKEFVRLAREDGSPIVRRYIASAMDRTPVPQRTPVLAALLTHAEDADDPNLPYLYWYATEPVVAANKTAAIQLLAKTKIPIIRQNITRRMATGK